MTKLVLRGTLVSPPWFVHIGSAHFRPTYLDLLIPSKWTRHLHTLTRHLNNLPLQLPPHAVSPCSVSGRTSEVTA